MSKEILDQLEEATKVLEAFKSDAAAIERIEKVADMMAECIKNGGKILSCGNGGSQCDAMHFAEELSGRFRENRPALPALALSDTSHITCVANDFGFDHIFSRYVDGLGKPGDVLLGISTSGNSQNIINAVMSAKDKKMHSIVLTGKSGGKLAELADMEIRVPHRGYSDRIQEIHIKVIHILVLLIEQKVMS